MNPSTQNYIWLHWKLFKDDEKPKPSSAIFVIDNEKNIERAYWNEKDEFQYCDCCRVMIMEKNLVAWIYESELLDTAVDLREYIQFKK